MNIIQYAAHPHIIIGTQLYYTHTSHECTFTWHIHTLHHMSDYKELPHTHTHTQPSNGTHVHTYLSILGHMLQHLPSLPGSTDLPGCKEAAGSYGHATD